MKVGHVVQEDVGRDGHLLLAALHIPVWQRDFSYKIENVILSEELGGATCIRRLVLQVVV